MGIVRFFYRGYKITRNAGLVVLGATGILFSMAMAKIFGIETLGSFGGDDAYADVPSYSQASYGGDSGDSGCCSDGGDSCG